MTLLKEIWWPWSYPRQRNIPLVQNSLTVHTKKEQNVFIWLSPFFPWVPPMNKNCWMGHSKELISLSRRESPLCLYLKYVLFPPVAEGIEIIRETASVGVVTGTHQLCSSVILRTAIRRDLSKSSAEQIDFDSLWLLYTCSLTTLVLQWRAQS